LNSEIREDAENYYVLVNPSLKAEFKVPLKSTVVVLAQRDGKLVTHSVIYPKKFFSKDRVLEASQILTACPYCNAGVTPIPTSPATPKPGGKKMVKKDTKEKIGKWFRTKMAPATAGALTKTIFDNVMTPLGTKVVGPLVALGLGYLNNKYSQFSVEAKENVETGLTNFAIYSLFDPSPEQWEMIKRDVEIVKTAVKGAQLGSYDVSSAARMIKTALVRDKIGQSEYGAFKKGLAASKKKSFAVGVTSNVKPIARSDILMNSR